MYPSGIMFSKGGKHVYNYRMDEFAPVPGIFLPGRATKDAEFMDTGDYDMLLGQSGQVSNRDQEYLQHSSLFGHKFMSGTIMSRLFLRLLAHALARNVHNKYLVIPREKVVV